MRWRYAIGLVIATVLLSLTASSWAWLALNMWQRHNQQHQVLEKQMQDVINAVNLLLQERQKR